MNKAILISCIGSSGFSFLPGLAWMLFYLLFSSAYGQNSTTPANLLNYSISPPSPTSAALARYGEVPVSLHTGIPQIAIPLFEVKTKHLSLPITLSYHAAGLRVEEMASWVGLGWSLNAGGIITRTVRGLPDDAELGFLRNPLPSDPLTQKDEYYDGIMEGRRDTEPDAFYFNFIGRSGQLLFFPSATAGGNGEAVTAPYQAIKVLYEREGGFASGRIERFIVTDESGTVYLFDQTEQSWQKEDQFDESKKLTQSWYLSRITSADGTETIQINYKAHEVHYPVNTSQTRYIRDPATFSADCPGRPDEAPVNRMEGTGLKVSRIEFPGGQVIFHHGSQPGALTQRRVDMAWEPLLAAMEIIGPAGPVKTFAFDYSYFTAGAGGGPCSSSLFSDIPGFDPLKRLRLDAVRECGRDGICLPPYILLYNAPDQLPSLCSYAQDHWGYYNGRNSNTTLIPAGEPVPLSYVGANRDASGEHAKVGMLSRMQYPTGGWTDFNYGGNTYYLIGAPSLKERSMDLAVTYHTLNEDYLNTLYAVDTIKVGYNPLAVSNGKGRQLYIMDINRFVGRDDPTSAVPSLDGDPAYIFYVNRIQNGASYRVLAWEAWPGHYQEDLYVGAGANTGDGWAKLTARLWLEPGTYAIECMVTNIGGIERGVGVQFFCSASFAYQEEVPQQYHHPAGGVRVERIDEYPGTGAQARTIIYSYERETQVPGLGAVKNPTGVLTYFPVYTYRLDEVANTGWICFTHVISSSNRLFLGSSQGGTVAYSEVTVLEGESGINGKTVYTFTVGETAYGGVPFAPTRNDTYKFGLPLTVTTYAREGARFRRVRYQENRYRFRDRPGDPNRYRVQGLKAQYKMISSNMRSYPDSTQNRGDYFYKVLYDVVSDWYYLEAVADTVFHPEGSPTASSIKYEYSPDHLQLRLKSTLDSKGNWQEEAVEYPGDLAPESNLYRRMVSEKHMLNTPVRTSEFVNNNNGRWLKRYTTVGYRDYGEGRFYPAEVRQLEKISSSDPGREELVAKVNSYDHYGNVEQYTKTGDGPLSSVWSKDGLFLLATAVHAKRSELYYNGFEEKEYADPRAKAGKGLSPGFEFKSPDGFSPAPNSILSYWRLENGKWELYKELYKGGSFTLSGLIDEVRIYPAEAQMTTYTYEPLIGMTSSTDANQVTTYYEYDAFGRLKLIKDDKGRMLKEFEYGYGR